MIVPRLSLTGGWTTRHLEPWLTTIMVMVNVGLAIAVIAGGPARFDSPSYSPLVDYVNGNTWIWGVWIGMSAILMTPPFRIVNIIGLWAGMFWHIVWMGSFIVATFHHEDAAVTPIPVYGGLAMICAALLTARVIDKPGG